MLTSHWLEFSHMLRETGNCGFYVGQSSAYGKNKKKKKSGNYIIKEKEDNRSNLYGFIILHAVLSASRTHLPWTTCVKPSPDLSTCLWSWSWPHSKPRKALLFPTKVTLCKACPAAQAHLLQAPWVKWAVVQHSMAVEEGVLGEPVSSGFAFRLCPAQLWWPPLIYALRYFLIIPDTACQRPGFWPMGEKNLWAVVTLARCSRSFTS